MNLAHGLGGGSDLPIPASYAVAGGTAALTLSFVVLLAAWRRPRFTPESGQGMPLAGLTAVVDSTAFRLVLRVAGFALFGYVAWAAVAGRDLLTNPTFGVVYVWLWVGIVPMSLLFGPFFRAVSPARTLHIAFARAVGADPDEGLMAYPASWGYWPAAIGLLAFVWLELVYPGATQIGPLRLWLAIYFAVMLVGGTLYGSRWLERADPFEVYSSLLGKLSIWGRQDEALNERRPILVRSPLRNLATVKAAPGLVAVVAVLLGSTGFDSFRSSTAWVRYSQTSNYSIFLLETGLLVLACALVGLVFVVATRATPVIEGVRSSRIPRLMAHSIVPIIVGYMIAHYLTFFVEYGQQTLIQLSDPLGTGADYLGTGDWAVDYWLSQHPTFLATVKVLAIVIGHVVGVVAAHDRALQTIPARHHVLGQLPLLAAMTLYTFAGLYLLFGL